MFSKTPSKQVTSVLLITARAGKLFVRTNQGRHNSLIAPLRELLQSYYTAFLTVIGAEELSAVLKLQLGEQNVSTFMQCGFISRAQFSNFSTGRT